MLKLISTWFWFLSVNLCNLAKAFKVACLQSIYPIFHTLFLFLLLLPFFSFGWFGCQMCSVIWASFGTFKMLKMTNERFRKGCQLPLQHSIYLTKWTEASAENNKWKNKKIKKNNKRVSNSIETKQMIWWWQEFSKVESIVWRLFSMKLVSNVIQLDGRNC